MGSSNNVLIPHTTLERSLVANLCQDILFSSEEIHFVSVINKNGRKIEIKIRNDRVIKDLTPQELDMFYMQRSLQASMSQEFDNRIDFLRYVILNRGSKLELVFPFSLGIVVVMTEPNIIPNIIPNYLAKKISFIIQEFDSGISDHLGGVQFTVAG